MFSLNLSNYVFRSKVKRDDVGNECGTRVPVVHFFATGEIDQNLICFKAQ